MNADVRRWWACDARPAGEKGPSAPVVRAERVELVSGNQRQAALQADGTGIDLVLFDAKDRVATAVRLSRDSTLSVISGDGGVVATLGGPSVKHLGRGQYNRSRRGRINYRTRLPAVTHVTAASFLEW